MTRIEIYGIIALVLALALAIGGAYAYGHHSGYVDGKQEVQVKFDAFVNETKAAGLKAEQDKIAKEKIDNEKIAAAVTSRDSAITSLRIAQARPRGGFVPNGSGSTADSRKVCYDRAALDAALRSLDTGVSGLLVEGDTQVINALTLLKAWPSAQPAIK